MRCMFPETKREVRDCPTCGTPTPHEKVGTTHFLHFMLVFFTCGLWIPVWLLFAAIEWRHVYTCTVCRSGSRTTRGGRQAA